jgi:hypothetical protein
VSELVGHGELGLLEVIGECLDVDRHLELRAVVVDGVDECQRHLVAVLAGAERGEQRQVGQLPDGRDVGEQLPGVEQDLVFVAEATLAEHPVDHEVSGGELGEFVLAERRR